ncbi:hypothetical protein AMATHDRAFT_145251 [Amanita thiersii Skay4041]|uniref:tRNA pseudouridine synthase n=1 Tax=Amanita thiersii Skay4041 TaxID=703135 RepID=A0A2A9NRQ6_9AGAR|nr:hypothetical protein AMATHDRAFT_145251 [Amanita thiersii Skay4041]
MPPKYHDWSQNQLIARITQLESKLQAIAPPSTSKLEPKLSEKDFQFSSYPRRKIALKFCYSGRYYNGLAYQTLWTPLPTVEGVLFDALATARLIDLDAGFEGCEWERCGRTDRGVSAAGQVVSLWVPHTKLEHDYIAILNRLLPSTIRITAWSPVSPSFSARFSCQYRHYKYFFSPDNLDISRMRAAAARMVGEHDFRNLCKLDPPKQITMFKRRIIKVNIDPVEDNLDGLYVLNLVGSAFLYHQVRHIMAVLFMVGTGLEHPSVITSLLNVAEDTEQKLNDDDPPLQVVNARPEYQMADALPLMLWECGYKPEDVDWRINAYTDENKRKGNNGDLYNSMEAVHEKSRISAALDQHFLEAARQHHPPPKRLFPTDQWPDNSAKVLMNVPLGGGTYKRMMRYTPLLDRVRMDPVEVVNERWRNGKGARKEERKKAEAENGVMDADGDE